MKCEYFLPEVVSNLLSEGKATVEVRKSLDKWYGVTYKEDKPFSRSGNPVFKGSGSVSAEALGGVKSIKKG